MELDRPRRLALALRPANRRLSILVAAAASSLAFVRCTASGARPAAPDVEVLLERGASEVKVALEGSYVVRDERGAAIAAGRRLGAGLLRADGDGVSLNGVPFAASAVVLDPVEQALFEHGGRRYAGELRVRRVEGGRLELTNVLDVEDYLAGVLYSEMPASFPEQALLAQTVAARSYARWRLEHGDRVLRATDADQVYGGAGALHARARSLVEETRGMVLEVDGEPLPAYFMSTCGGATVDGRFVFRDAPAEGLVGVPCDWCTASPKYRWSRTLPRRELERRLDLAADSLRALAARRDAFGHTLSFAVSAGGRTRSFDGQEFRRLWNAAAASEAEKLPSAWFRSFDLGPSALGVEGAGFGHGVGLCQYGAAGLARAGQSWREILRFYYRGANVVKRW